MATIYPIAAERSALEAPRIVGSLSFAAAERQVKEGKLQRVYDKRVLIGYERIPPSTAPRYREERNDETGEAVVQPSQASITAAEMDINAGTKFKRGRSRTSRFHPNAIERFNRVHAATGRILPPEDRVERVVEKVRQFGESRLVCA